MSAKRVSELHGLSFRVHHSRGWRSCTFSFLPDFMAKTQNPSIPDSRFKEFSVPLLDDFTGDDLLLSSIRALRKYLSRTEQFRSGIEGLFVSAGHVKKRVSCNTISFWLNGSCFCFRRELSCTDSQGSQSQEGRDVFTFQEEQSGPPGTEGGNMVLPVNLLGLLSEGCRPQALGHLLSWSCGGGSTGRVTR